jgi:hypothetical protein
MSKVTRVKALAAAFAVLFLMNSCVDFFSNSWGDSFKRDPKKVKVTASNVYDLLDAAKGDPDLSREILNKIKAGDNNTLKQAAIKAANQAAGISTLALENVQALIDAAEGSDTDALETLANKIMGKGNDIVDIAGQLTKILVVQENPGSSGSALTASSSVTLGSVSNSVALKKAGEVTVSVPKTDGGGTAMVTINVGSDGTGTATITTPEGTTTYNCEIKNDETITLTNTQNGGKVADIGYKIDDDHLTLSGLDQIAGAGLAPASNPSNDTILIPPGKPEFKPDFIDGVSDSDLTLMVMTLVLAKIEDVESTYPDLDAYLKDWKDKKKNVETGEGLDPDELLIAATVNGMISRGELTGDETELTKMLKDLLGMGD